MILKGHYNERFFDIIVEPDDPLENVFIIAGAECEMPDDDFELSKNGIHFNNLKLTINQLGIKDGDTIEIRKKKAKTSMDRVSFY